MTFRLDIRTKLSLTLLIILLVPSLAIGLISLRAAESKVKSDIHDSAVTSMQLFDQSVNDLFSEWMSDVSYLGKELNVDTFPHDGPTDTSPVQTTLSRFGSEHKTFLNVYVGTDMGEIILRPYQKLPAGYDPRKRPWYQLAMQNPNKVVITSPYQDAGSGSMIITIAESLPNGHGVVAADITLASLTKMASQVKIGQHGYLTILDSNRQVIASPAFKLGSVVKDKAFDALYHSATGEFSAPINGSSDNVVFATNALTGWKIAGVMLPGDVQSATAPIRNTTFIVIVLSLLVGAVLAYLVTQSITRPLRSLLALSKTVSEGDLSQHSEIRSKDEIGQLGQGFNNMIDSLRAIIQEVLHISGQVAASSEQLSASAEETSRATETIAETMQQMASGTEEQSHNIQHSSNIVKEMNDGIRVISTRANNVTELAVTASDAASAGSTSLQSVQDQMNAIQTTVDGLSRNIQRLEERSTEVRQILDVIADISSQTNLLALNAAIEAARAGEHGRGFAVVAEQVRKLAEQSAQSAKQIADVINSIQADTMDAVQVTHSVTDEVVKGLATVEAAGNAFERIRSAVTQVASQIQEVSEAVHSLSSGSDAIVSGMSRISEVAATTANGTQNVSAAAEEQLASMEEITASAASLARMAEQLQSLIGKFTI